MNKKQWIVSMLAAISLLIMGALAFWGPENSGLGFGVLALGTIMFLTLFLGLL